MKTNEELVIMIQDGDESKVPELWERVRGIYMKKAFRYYGTHKTLCDRCGVELDDVQQQSFFAFLKSIETYEPEREFKFTTYIDYPFKTEMQELTRTRSSGQLADCLNRCESLDNELNSDDGDGSTLHDLVPDPAALDFLELLDAESVGAMIRNEVRQLPEKECAIITGIFFDGQTLGQIADRLGITYQRVSQLKKRGLVMLSRRRALVDLWNETHHTNELRKLESSTRSNNPQDFDSTRIYERKIMPHDVNSPIDIAFVHAEKLRKAAEASGEEWTREKKITAIVEYLTQPQTVPG